MRTSSFRRIFEGATALACIVFAGNLHGQAPASSCSECAVWNKTQTPFRIYGDTYYVGPHGLSSILITSDAGDILIDGALPESASQIAANISALGFQIKDVKLIVNSHAHFDHAGGLAALQKQSNAEMVASKWSAAALKTGRTDEADPQYGLGPAVPPVKHIRILRDGENFRVGRLVITAHATPGHTPGGTSWTWRSCEADRCLDMVYADSLSAISAPGFKFTHSETYPHAMQDFAKSLAFLRAVPCDILITPHPDASGFWERAGIDSKGAASREIAADSTQCRRLADDAESVLQQRVNAEKEK